MVSLFFNKFTASLVGLVVVALLIVGLYFSWKHQIQQEALLDFNNKQIQQVAKDVKDENAKLDVISGYSQQVLTDMNDKNDAINSSLNTLKDGLDLASIKKQNKESSDILKKVIKSLPTVK